MEKALIAGAVLCNPFTWPLAYYAVGSTAFLVAAGTAMAVGQAVLMTGTLSVTDMRDRR